MNRHLVFVGLGTALLAVGVAALLGCGSGCSMNLGSIHWTGGGTYVDGVKLDHETTLHFSSAEKPERFTLSLESASIEVVGDASVAGVEADLIVREKEAGDASLAAGTDTIAVRSAGGHPTLVKSAKVRVPPGTAVDVTTSFGSVAVKGIHGAAKVSAKSDNGSVTLEDLADLPSVAGESSFGKVTLSGGRALGDVSLTTDNGAVSATSVRGGKTLHLESDFGAVSAASCDASESMTLETSNGSVEVVDVQTARAKLHSDFGGITATRSIFDHVEGKTSNGSVKLSGCKYKTKDLDTDFGKVKETD